MASYGLDERFKDPRYCFRLNDPGAYSNIRRLNFKQNKYGFLSSAPRVTLASNSLYTDNIYDTSTIRSRIPNATCFKSKTPRFIHKPFTEEELEEILCRCGIEKTCECPLGEEKECQARIYKRLFKGPPPHSALGVGLSIPTKRDRGFEILHDGTARRLLAEVTDEGPDFYNSTVHHHTDFFRGCKWSRWTEPRKSTSLEVRPGPADYYIEKEKTQNELCAERVRADRRKNSKQLRFIEIVQNRNIRENRPGPADYSPQPPQRTDLQFLGPKANRFLLYKCEERPSPATYSVKRDFDLPEPPKYPCRAKLPLPASFGVSAQRFKNRIQDFPGPASYDARVKLCRILNCSKAPFGCSAIRFKEEKFIDDSDEDVCTDEEDEETTTCPAHTWQFKSKTKRFAPKKTFDPYIPNITKPKVKRSLRIQQLAPFNISQVRFQNWYDWLPVHAGADTPGPAYYNWNKATCLPAVNAGPLFRAHRFKTDYYISPAPNEYKIEGCVDTILETHNKRLKLNANKRRVQYKWTRQEIRHLSFLEREQIILDRAIKQLEIEPEPAPEIPSASLVVLKEEDDVQDSKRGSVAIKPKRFSSDNKGENLESTGTGKKRASSDKGEKRASGDKGEKRASGDKGEKRASGDKGEKRASFGKSEKHISEDKHEKRVSIDKKERPSTDREKLPSIYKGESHTSILKKEKRLSVVDKEVTLTTEETSKVPEKSNEHEVTKVDIVPPKKKLLRTFLYNHPTLTYY